MPSSSNRVRLGIVREVTPGTIPAAPAFRTLRVTAGGLTAKPKTITSQEIRSDAMQPDLSIVGKDIGGSIDFEFTKDTADLIIEEAIRSPTTKSPESIGVTTVAAGTGVYTFPAGAGAVFVAGNYVRMSGFSNAANNGYFRCTSVTSTTVTTDNTSSVSEASPPATSRIKAVGYKALANADITAVTAGGNKLTSVLNPASFGLIPGRWFRALNFVTAANNDWYRVSSITGSGPYNIFCDKVPTGFVADGAAAAKVVLAFGDYFRNGTTRLSHATEKAMLDAPAVIYDYRMGEQANQLTLDMQDDQIIKLTASMMAMDTLIPSTSQFASATNVAANTAPVMNTSTGLSRLAEALTALNGGTANLPLGAKIMINNNLRVQGAIGQVAAAGLGFGTLEVTGEFDVYLDTPTLLAKLWNNTPSSFDARYVDANGDGYAWDVPTIKYEDGDNPLSGANQDITPKMAWRGIVTTPSAGNAYVIHIEKFELVA